MFYNTMVKCHADLMINEKDSTACVFEDEETAQWHRETFKHALLKLDAMLAGKKYLCTQDLMSWVDIVVYAEVTLVLNLCFS